MAEITLSNGRIALVDDADLPKVQQWKWKQHREGYAYRYTRKGNLYLHRLLMQPEEGCEVDHINRDRLDNRRENLRVVPHWANVHNRKPRRNNSSGHRGVSLPKGRTRWRACLRVNGQHFSLGSFKTREEAIAAYEAARIKHGIVQP